MMTKHYLLAIMLIMTAWFLPTVAMANDGFYVGLNTGQSYFKDALGQMNGHAEILTINCSACTYRLSISNREFGYQGFVGYRFNDYFALEGGYADFGKATGTAVGPYVSGFPFNPSNSGTVHSEMEAHGTTLDAMISYPLTHRFLIFGKIGIIAAHGA
ncbi:MAG: outer membrane beta-barrel protein, partial [Candidatus Dormibacteria bacterium]